MAKIHYEFGQLLHKDSRLRYIQDADPIVYENKQRKRMGYFFCECGKLIKTSIGDAKLGKSLSCGCLELELARKRLTTHGMSGTSEYHAWKDIQRRCHNPDDKAYPNYGGRGISVCQRWRDTEEDGFDNFIEDMGLKTEPSLTLERLDTNGNYEPENCTWADWSTQLYNRRFSKRNKSGKRGVCYDKKNGKWMAYITKDRKLHNLGRYDTVESAYRVRREAELKFYGYNLDYIKEDTVATT